MHCEFCKEEVAVSCPDMFCAGLCQYDGDLPIVPPSDEAKQAIWDRMNEPVAAASLEQSPYNTRGLEGLAEAFGKGEWSVENGRFVIRSPRPSDDDYLKAGDFSDDVHTARG